MSYNTHSISRRMAFDPAFGDTRPSATLMRSSFKESSDVSIADLVGARIVMQAVVTHFDPGHDHTCSVCLADHVLYYWACVGVGKSADSNGEATAEGFFITDVRNCKAKATVKGKMTRLIPFSITGEIVMSDDGIAFSVNSGTLVTLADILDNKWQIQATGLPATPKSAKDDARIAEMLRIHMTALFSGKDTVDDDEKMDLAEFVADPTYCVVIPNLSSRLNPLIESLEEGSLSHIEQGARLLNSDDKTEAESVVRKVTEGAAFYMTNILACISDEWWTDVYRKFVEQSLASGETKHTDNPTHTNTHVRNIQPAADTDSPATRDEDGRLLDNSPAPTIDDSSMWDDIRNLL